MTFKVPEVVEPQVYGFESKEHWHTWTCGCQTRITNEAFEIIPCNVNCGLYLTALEEGGLYDENPN